LRFFGAFALLLALPELAAGQSLGETARKERERREKLRQAGDAAPLVTDDELAANKGTLANDPKQAVPAQPEAQRPATRGGRAVPQERGVPNAEAFWRSRASAARRRAEEAQERCDAFQRMIRFGQPGSYDANGRLVIYSQQQMKQMADAADAELASAQAALEQLLEDGRRAGALPGWLR
jgi:hypothetical protein